jgi:pimeloyl-ACP methyl ester carboxylesterase
MRRFNVGRQLLTLFMTVVVLSTLFGRPAQSQSTVQEPGTIPPGCVDGAQGSGAIYRICMPTTWNNKLVVYAHGYVAPNRPLGIPEDQMVIPGTTTRVDQVVNSRGYAFATSGYRVNGLAVRQGVADLVEVASLFTTLQSAPEQVLLVGVSEGGLIATLGVEQHADVFDGGLSMCGPYGNFGDQVDYFGDFRVVFDFYFPGLIPGSLVEVPANLLDTWESSYYTGTVEPQIIDPNQASRVDQLLAVTGAAFDAFNMASKENTIEQILWYNIYATNDARLKLGGQPFDNQQRTYRGSTDDNALNQNVQRFAADQAAHAEIAAHYETSGRLTVPLVTLHTTGDPVIPYWHAIQYRGKTVAADNLALHEPLTVVGYGHCQFGLLPLLTAFARLESMVANPPAYRPAQRVYLPLLAR